MAVIFCFINNELKCRNIDAREKQNISTTEKFYILKYNDNSYRLFAFINEIECVLFLVNIFNSNSTDTMNNKKEV